MTYYMLTLKDIIIGFSINKLCMTKIVAIRVILPFLFIFLVALYRLFDYIKKKAKNSFAINIEIVYRF